VKNEYTLLNVSLYDCVKDSHVTLDCVIANRHHRVVIGNKWANVNDISQRYNVSIKFPERTTTTQSNSQEGPLLLHLLQHLYSSGSSGSSCSVVVVVVVVVNDIF